MNSLEQVIVDNGCLFPLEDLALEGNLANVEAIAQQVCERNRASQATPTDRADADSPGRKIAAGESLARDRFDSDCVLGTQFESSQPDQSLTIPQRFPGAAPNTPEMALIAGSTRSLDSAELPRRRFRPFCLCIKKIDFPGKRRPTRPEAEGFYTITHGLMNPNSNYYLAINTGFPNAYDRANDRHGGFLMIHGDCSSRGCYG